MKKAFVTGITGQDGSYLAELLIEKGYQVHGLVRNKGCVRESKIGHLCENLGLQGPIFLHQGDMSDGTALSNIIDQIEPDEVYNLAAMSHMKASFDVPEYTADIVAVGVARLLSILKNRAPQAKFFQAGSSEIFGKVRETPQTESTPFHPRSIYGAAKLFAYWAVVNYRESNHLFACNGILFNHESPRRGETFVSRKITLAAARIKHGLQDRLLLGNVDAQRDWGYAKDFVEGMWLMLQQPNPEDFILATGVTTSVRKFVELTFSYVGIELEWAGKGILEKGLDKKTGKVIVEIDPAFFRPADSEILTGNPTKAFNKLGWKSKTTVEQLVETMIKNDLLLQAAGRGS